MQINTMMAVRIHRVSACQSEAMSLTMLGHIKMYGKNDKRCNFL